MHLPNLKTLLLITCFFCCKLSFAQSNYHNIIFKIDSLAAVGLPKSALAEVDKLDAIARKENNSPQLIRAVIYRLKFQTYLNEDALVAVISSLKNDITRAEYPVKPVLQSFLGDMYWKYYEQNRYNFSNRTRRENADIDFRNWDLSALINAASQLYSQSLQDAAREQNTPVDVLEGVLTGDKHTRYLRPTLYDLLLHRAFDYFLANEPAITRPKMPFNINDPRFFSDSKTFAGISIKTTDTASTYYNGLKFLQQATAFHLQKNNREALVDLTLQRLEFLYPKTSLFNKDTLYVAALKNIAADTAAKDIAADALFNIAGFYSNQNKYTVAMVYLQKAVSDHPKSLGGKNAANLITNIRQKTLSGIIEDFNIPNRPILSLINYRNIKSARYTVYAVTEGQLALLGKMDDNSRQLPPGKKTMAFLKTLKPVQSNVLNLPPADDYQAHSTEFKIDPLARGTYILKLNQIAKKDSLVQLSTFKVSGITFLMRNLPNGKSEIRVANRQTGEMIKGATVTVTTKPNYQNLKQKPVTVSGITDENGAFLFELEGPNFAVTINFEGDHLESDRSIFVTNPINISDELIQATLLYTDRQIYRPGQTIYFNALQIQHRDGISKLMPNASLSFKLKDDGGRELSTLNLQTNEFGTAAGSFTIPQNILNGSVTISTNTGLTYLRIEEYKRPTFSVEFEPVTQTYKLGDSVTLKGKAMAFSGYGLSNASVAYSISRSTDFSVYNQSVAVSRIRNSMQFVSNAIIAVDTVKTDEQGNFQIKYLADKVLADGWDETYNFTTTASVTDASDETQTASVLTMIGTKTIKLGDNMPQSAMVKFSFTKEGMLQLPQNITVKLTNTNNQPQTGKINVQVYKLIGPETFFKNRLWGAPDKQMISKADFKKDFPSFAYENEDNYENWKRGDKVNELDLSVDKGDTAHFELVRVLKAIPGVYQFVIKATAENGDTVSVTHFVNFSSNRAAPQKPENWVSLLNTEIEPRGSLQFYVGIGKKCDVLLETYDDTNRLMSSMLPVPEGPSNIFGITIPSTATHNLTLQLTVVNDNRWYTFYRHVTIKDTIKPLDIRFLTFRNKLQPGEKEQWKLQISGMDKKQSAELMATLYDASLDKVAFPQSWQTNLNYTGSIPPNYVWQYGPISSAVYSIQNDNYIQNRYYDDNGGGGREYENIDMQDYNYDASSDNYEAYQNEVTFSKKGALSDKKLSAQYLKNAALIKNGYDVVGRVIEPRSKTGLAGIRVIINGSAISTVTNSLGYFKIKVPANAVLVISGTRMWGTKKVLVQRGQRMIINMPYSSNLRVADPGVKSQQGDPNADIRIDEPVGNSDIKAVQEKAFTGAPGYRGSVKTRLYGNEMHYDELNGGNMTVLREILTQPGQKFDKDLLKKTGAMLVGTDIPIVTRKNFNETAFFYPQLHTDENGQVLIDFTIPESLTKWKFKGLAHTKALQMGYIEQEVITQKQLMISANTPRFLRKGDELTVSARVINLTRGALKGKARLQLFNALNMQPVNLLVKGSDAEQPFKLDSLSTGAVSFKLSIPSGLEALTYRLTATAGNFTDGEENTLPVLPNNMLVTETMPMMVRAGETKSFTFDKLVNQSSTTLKSKTLTLEYTQNPAWSAVQSLPYLMEFPYECSEQIFSRFYANSFAGNIINHFPQIKQTFEQWKTADSKALLSNLEKNPELKSVLLEETPWLNEAMNETEQKKRIAQLFDLNKMSYEITQNLTKLQKKQLPGGGFPWFGGDNPDQYITQHIIAGIGQLNHLKIADTANAVLKVVSNNALTYLGKQLKADELSAKKHNKKYMERPLSPLEIHAWYARSYFKTTKTDAELSVIQKTYLNRASHQWTFQPGFEKAMIALTLYRNGDKETSTAIIKSLLETARQSNELGMYWSDNKAGYYWDQSPIETQTLMIELFTEATDNPTAVNEMKIWLLRNKQTNNWQTTKATAAACYALLIRGGDILTDTAKTNIVIDGKPLASLKPEIKTEAGAGYLKTSWVDEQIKPSLGHVQISNTGKTINWGAMYWQYTEQLDKITPSNTNVKLQRKYFIQKQTDAGPVLIAADDAHQPKTGDILKVVINLQADRDFDYIQLKDMRPAGTEPVDVLSSYKYQDGLYYYQVSKDVATNFFISTLKKGNYVFEYQLRMVQPGNYATGITSLQSMYAPEFNAHSQGQRLLFISNEK